MRTAIEYWGDDNAEGKGPHRHEGHKETPVPFESIEILADQFLNEVDVLRRKLQDKWNSP